MWKFPLRDKKNPNYWDVKVDYTVSDIVDQDKTVRFVQSDLDLHGPQKLHDFELTA